MTLTAEGQLFLEEAREKLRRADESIKKVRALARGEYGELHVCYAPTPTIEILPPALAAFQKSVPGVQVLLHDMSGEEIADGLRRGTIHLAVMPSPELEHIPDVEFEPLRAYPVCVALPRDHPLVRMKSIPLEKFAAEPLVNFSRKEYPGAYSSLERLLRHLGIKPRVVLEVDSGSSAVAAIEAGRGIALTIPVFKLVTGNRLVYRPLVGVTEMIAVGIARARNGDLTPAGEKFCEALRKLAKGGIS